MAADMPPLPVEVAADPARRFAAATTALALLAVDPAGLGGMVLRARAGPVRDAFCDLAGALPLPVIRLHPGLTDATLFGGIDLAATLAAGRLVEGRGLLADPAVLRLGMAERCPAGLAARLALALDRDGGHCLFAMDEGAAPDEAVPPALAERVAFRADLDGVGRGDLTGLAPDDDDLAAARAGLHAVTLPADAAQTVAELAEALGVDSPRAALFCLRAARAHAALAGRSRVEAEDLETACALTLAHRATRLPAPPEPPEPEDRADDRPDDAPDPQEPDAQGPDEDDILSLPQDLLLEAVRAMLPDGLLAQAGAGRIRQAKGSGSGAVARGNRRGRPLPARAGGSGSGARIDIVATLRAAAPWQTIRARAAPDRTGPHVRATDLRHKRFEDRSDRLLIFAVDASGSAALARLAEAKGAVELLLAQAYARRDHVALLAFRGTGAEVLLPPTRSLVQTKRRLAGLPGGGATPLAAGLQAAMALAAQTARHGLAPTMVLLTDGRANIALDGTANRTEAAADALRLARRIHAEGVAALVIDTGNRPEPALRELARVMAAPYLALPRADANRLSRAVTAALDP